MPTPKKTRKKMIEEMVKQEEECQSLMGDAIRRLAERARALGAICDTSELERSLEESREITARTRRAGTGEGQMEKKFFKWSRDCGGLTPTSMADLCRREQVTFRKFAEDFAADWNVEKKGPPPVDLVEGIVRDLEAAFPSRRKKR